jgi:hypothetical protein
MGRAGAWIAWIAWIARITNAQSDHRLAGRGALRKFSKQQAPDSHEHYFVSLKLRALLSNHIVCIVCTSLTARTCKEYLEGTPGLNIDFLCCRCTTPKLARIRRHCDSYGQMHLYTL